MEQRSPAQTAECPFEEIVVDPQLIGGADDFPPFVWEADGETLPYKDELAYKLPSYLTVYPTDEAARHDSSKPCPFWRFNGKTRKIHSTYAVALAKHFKMDGVELLGEDGIQLAV